MESVKVALQHELSLKEPLCFTDSKAMLYWIRDVNHEWNQFVENRVTALRRLVAPQRWSHCPGTENPADIPSRGMSLTDLLETPLYLDGPDWLRAKEPIARSSTESEDSTIPDDCQCEMKRGTAHTLTTVGDAARVVPRLSNVMDLKRYSSSQRLFKVTALALRFIHCLRCRCSGTSPPTLCDKPLDSKDIN